MGLDMYLDLISDSNENDVHEVAYWRKASMIHNWFVENVQNGVDDCNAYVVEVEQIKLLLDICQKLNDSFRDVDSVEFARIAEEELPCANGFFFGSNQYDCAYAQDIEKTVYMLKRGLALYEQKERQDSPMHFVYASSW